MDGGTVPLFVTRRASPTLIVTFAGAIDRQKHVLPYFAAPRLPTYVPASVIEIADPSLAQLSTLATAWYAGHEGFETQHIFPTLIERMATACDAERVIFLGGSSGGFAALYYSWRLPHSIAIVMNPQTDLDRYNPSPIRRYRTSCRPSLGKDAPLATVIASNLATCYAQCVDNTVIYLQNASDSAHVRNQFAPFIAAIDLANQKHVLPRLHYWGREGHKPPPAHAWLEWLTAAIASPTSAAGDIQHTRKEHNLGRVETSASAKHDGDYRLAATIVAQAKAQSVESIARSDVSSVSSNVLTVSHHGDGRVARRG
jgi:hypothetical protein